MNTLKEFVQFIWTVVIEVMSLEIPLFEYKFTYLQLMIYGYLVYIILKFLFNFGEKE